MIFFLFSFFFIYIRSGEPKYDDLNDHQESNWYDQ